MKTDTFLALHLAWRSQKNCAGPSEILDPLHNALIHRVNHSSMSLSFENANSLANAGVGFAFCVQEHLFLSYQVLYRLSNTIFRISGVRQNCGEIPDYASQYRNFGNFGQIFHV